MACSSSPLITRVSSISGEDDLVGTGALAAFASGDQSGTGWRSSYCVGNGLCGQSSHFRIWTTRIDGGPAWSKSSRGPRECLARQTRA